MSSLHNESNPGDCIAVTPVLPMGKEGARQLRVQDQPHTLHGPCSLIISHFETLQQDIKPSAGPLHMSSDCTGQVPGHPCPRLSLGRGEGSLCMRLM